MLNYNNLFEPEFLMDIVKTNQKIAVNLIDNFPGQIHDQKDLTFTYFHYVSKILAYPKENYKVQKNYFSLFQNQFELLRRLTERQEGREYSPLVTPEKNDKRFKAPEWNQSYFDFLKQNHLLVSNMLFNIIEELELDPKKRKKLHFYTGQFLDAFSPSNFFATNPEVLKTAIETKGASLINGFKNLMKDIQNGRITQTDDVTYKVGKNMAITPGSVVYRNDLIELIQYAPLTAEVHKIPLLVIPPWINKYYILDLEEKNSFVRYAVEQGFTVFIISWINPTPEMGNISFDDYVENGILKSIEVVREITGVAKVNTLGYCIGGTLLGVTLAVLLAKKQDIINSATFLGAMLDFSNIGPMGDVIEEALVRKLERGEIHRKGVMPGRVMESAFNLIRAKDLVWNYVINDYLKGTTPAPFAVIQWTSDNTNLPANMYLFYIRQMVLENRLSKRNAISVCGVPLNVHKIKTPAFVVGMQEDYISPCRTVFTTTELLRGPVEFVLGGSGHVMGVANPPSKNKYGYLMGGVMEEGFDEWHKTAKSYDGSWWVPWSKWLAGHSDELIASKKQLGSDQFPELIAAPGTYVYDLCCEIDIPINGNLELA